MLLGRDDTRLAQELGMALRTGQIEIRYQPQFSCADGALAGAEALARWHHLVFGEIGAHDLFDLAGKVGMGEAVPNHALSLAIAQAGEWPEGLSLSLNVAPRQLLGEGFVERLLGEIDLCTIDPACILLEITEQTLLDDLDLAQRRLGQLRAHGLRIALDDFGAGFCNFEYLKRLPLDVLKLDRAMVRDIASSRRDLAVFRAMVSLARALELEVVAEGIESEAQRAAVCEEGCSAWQGYLGAAPLPLDGLLALANG